MPKLARIRNSRIMVPLSMVALLQVVLFVFFLGCSSSDSDDNPTGPIDPVDQKNGCEECHTSEATLIATASPDTLPPAGSSGEG